MPSVSKSQQRLMGVAYAVKSGSMELKDVDSEYRDKVESLVDGMTKKDLKKYASTKHDKLPETVDEAFIGPYVFNDKMSDEELKAMYVSALDGYAYYQKGMHYAKSDYKKAYQEIEKILKKRGVAVDETVQQTAITPQSIGGMGPVKLPNAGELGSGDIPHTLVQVADIDDDEEKKKQKGTVKNLQAEELALTFQAFLNEATDYNDPVLIRLRQNQMRKADMAKLDAMKKEAEKNRKKAMKRWNQKKYDQWLEDVASNGGAENAFDMAQNAEFEPGLIDWVKKEFPYDDAYQRIQWDIEAFAESVVTEARAVKRFDKKLIDPNFQVHQESTLRTIYKGVSGNVNVEVSDKFIELKGLEDIPEDWRGQHIGRFYQLKRNLYLWAKDMEDTRTGRAAVDEFGDAFFNVMSIFTIDGDEISILWDRPSNFKVATYGGPGVNLQYESVVNEKKLDRDDMMAWIGKYMRFVSTTEEFNGSKGGIWVSGEDGDEYKGRVIYAYYSEDYKNRTFGVDNRWEKELNKRGWYSEWHDAGTSMIWPL